MYRFCHSDMTSLSVVKATDAALALKKTIVKKSSMKKTSEAQVQAKLPSLRCLTDEEVSKDKEFLKSYIPRENIGSESTLKEEGVHPTKKDRFGKDLKLFSSPVFDASHDGYTKKSSVVTLAEAPLSLPAYKKYAHTAAWTKYQESWCVIVKEESQIKRLEECIEGKAIDTQYVETVVADIGKRKQKLALLHAEFKKKQEKEEAEEKEAADAEEFADACLNQDAQ